MTLIDHLENHLGEISHGWKDNSSVFDFRVVSFENQPFGGVRTYSTLGLSDFILPMVKTKEIRQELIFSANERFDIEQVASFLSTFAESIASSNKALLRGDIIGPTGPVIFGTLLNSVYSAIPVVFEESFAVFDETNPPTVFVWVIPIHETEVNFVRSKGWKKFEAMLESKEPDLWNLTRDPIV
jgi:hypothetical protein